MLEISMPHTCGGIFGEESRECKRSEMHPVPVHRSRIRRCGWGNSCDLRSDGRREARWFVMDSVSGLGWEYMISMSSISRGDTCKRRTSE